MSAHIKQKTMMKINTFSKLYLGFNICAMLFVGALGQAQTNSQEQKTGINRIPITKIDQKKYTGKSVSEIIVLELNLSSSYSFIPSEKTIVRDKLGMTHIRFNQYYNGFKVEFAQIITHYGTSGDLLKFNGSYFNVESVNTSVSISADIALNNGLEALGIITPLWEDQATAEFANYEKPEGELVILADPLDDAFFRFTWKFNLFAKGQAIRDWVYVDASTGEIVLRNPIIKHAHKFGHDGGFNANIDAYVPTLAEAKIMGFTESVTLVAAGDADTKYSGDNQPVETLQDNGTYALFSSPGATILTYDANNAAANTTTGIELVTDPNNDNDWTAAEFPGKAQGELDAHWGAEEVYEYWDQVHGRNSYDGAGATIYSLVHVSTNYDNAFWNGSWMSYGDGSSNGNEGNGNFDILTSLDVCAHEIGHAVISTTANLAYQRESGGLNEGFADIWAATVEHRAKGTGTDTNPNDEIWLIGDEIDRRSGSIALRSMSNPNAKSQPDTWRGDFWQPATVGEGCNIPDGNNNDYCGVHTNSGVLNYWFYLLVEGGYGTNDNADTFNVSEIGMNKAELIAFRTLNVYLTANSDFADARVASIEAATDIYGACSAETRAVVDAWQAVGVGENATTVYNGQWSNGIPTATSGKHVKFSANYNTSGVNIDACSCDIETGITVTVAAGDYMKMEGNFTNSGTFTLDSTENDFASLIVEGTATGDIVYNRYVNSYTNGWDLIGAPVAMTITDFISANENNIEVLGDDYAFSQWDNVNKQWAPYATASQEGSFTAGQGYSMATIIGATQTYTGPIATTTQSINIVNAGGNGSYRRWNLVSNPFPSYISGNNLSGASNFLDENSAVIDDQYVAVYGWNGTDYTIYNNTTGPLSMAPGQGFFIASSSTEPEALSFTAAMRTTTGTGDFVLGPQSLTYNVTLKLYNGETEKAATNFYFKEGLSLGLDPGYDAAAFDQSIKLSTRLPEGAQETAFAINAMGIDDLNNTSVPLEIKQNAGQVFHISIADSDIPEGIYVYLEDTLNGTFTSLKEQDFELTAQSNLSGADRFFIVFKENSVLSNGDALGINALHVYKANTDNFVTIAGISPELGQLDVTLYNILGMTVREKTLNNATGTQTISTEGLASGLYIIKVASGNELFTKKIIVE
jgi:Zn-dependent metalloprotease